MFHAQELGSYAQGQGSLAVFKVTARDQGHYKGPWGAFVTYCNISCLLLKGEPIPIGQVILIFVSPAKQKRDICTAFPAASSSSSSAAA